MLTYIDNGDTITGPSGECIPKAGGNRHYQEMLKSIEDGMAELVETARPTLTETIAAKTAAIQTEKCRIRDEGFDVEGTHFDSDQAARMSYMEYAMEIAANPTYSKDWKASEGIWVTMDATFFAKVKAVGEAVFTAAFNWQKARDAELAAIKVAVAAGTMTEEAAKAAVAAVSATYTA